MKRTIWRYTLHTHQAEHAVEVPLGGELLSVRAIRSHAVELFFLVDVDEREDLRRFLTVRAGVPFDVPEGHEVLIRGMTDDPEPIHVLELRGLQV